MYYVGKYAMRIGNERRLPGAPVPEASKFPNLRRLLQKGHLRCDYKDGEPHLTELPPVTRSTIVKMPEMCSKIEEATGLKVAEGTPEKEVRKVYGCLVNELPLPDDVSFLVSCEVEVPADEADTEALLDALAALSEESHLSTIRAKLKQAGLTDVQSLDKEAALDKVAEILLECGK